LLGYDLNRKYLLYSKVNLLANASNNLLYEIISKKNKSKKPKSSFILGFTWSCWKVY